MGEEEKENLLRACEKYEQATKLNHNDGGAFSNWGVALFQLARIEQDEEEKENLLREECEKYILIWAFYQKDI